MRVVEKTNFIQEKKQKEICELPKGNRISSVSVKLKKNRKQNKKNMPNVIRKLFRTCNEVFTTYEAGTVPSFSDIERLKVILDSMGPADVGLTLDMPYFRRIDSEGSPPITYLHLYESEKFSIGIFCLPPSAVIPLHNHPGMTVFSKLLFGSMHIKSYDWTELSGNANGNLDPPQAQPTGVRLAEVKVDCVFNAPCNTSILYPADGGNMHCFTAMTSCAVLDVLGPPYSNAEGRHCTYYQDFPYKSFPGEVRSVAENEREGYVWLEEREKPDDFNVVGAMYRGPKVR